MSKSVCICCTKKFENLQNRKRKRCHSCNTKIRRFRAKIAAIEFLGGCCSHCGYDAHPSALEFHHVNATNKDFTISSVSNKSWVSIKEELLKCILLCSNCHRIEHGERYKGEFIDIALSYNGTACFDGFFKKAIDNGVIEKIKKVKQKPHNFKREPSGGYKKSK